MEALQEGSVPSKDHAWPPHQAACVFESPGHEDLYEAPNGYPLCVIALPDHAFMEKYNGKRLSDLSPETVAEAKPVHFMFTNHGPVKQEEAGSLHVRLVMHLESDYNPIAVAPWDDILAATK